eukprot:TRINITY_DN3059_c0_g4_i2.p1 TRINITY_DN3059_c0_g4~~TRINITY_DN3059_c0_g4_i2.p1  ORF type:complete len:570 (+),score=55.92 TRINITY_DN3059_c0_g4_i2:228-1937(+)
MLTPTMRTPTGKEVFFSVDDPEFCSDQFRMYEFKVKRCPRAKPHDWTLCPFSHPGEKAKRRDPKRYRYSGTACPEFRKSACCRRGDACPFAHGVFECWLHPARYRTQLCTDGTACKRRVCFFAHLEEEVRKPSSDPLMLNSGSDVGIIGGIDIDKLSAMSHILGLNQQDTIPVGMPDSIPVAPHSPIGDMQSELIRSLTPGNSSPLPPAQGAEVVPNLNNSNIQTQIKMLQIQQQINELQELERQQKESQARQQQLLRDVMAQLGDTPGSQTPESAQLVHQSQFQQAPGNPPLMEMANSMQQVGQEQTVNILMASQPSGRLSPSPIPMPTSPTVQRSEHSFTSQGSGIIAPVSVALSQPHLVATPSSPGLSPVPSSSQLIRPAISASNIPQTVSASGQVDALINLLASQSDRQDDIGKLVGLLKAAGSVHPEVLQKIQEVLAQQEVRRVGRVSGSTTPTAAASAPVQFGSGLGSLGAGVISTSLSTPVLPIPTMQTSSPPPPSIWNDTEDDRLQQVLAVVQKTGISAQHNRNSSLESLLNDLPRCVTELNMADSSQQPTLPLCSTPPSQ